jgi:ubiquinone/menaquinone biosynthesis C-methylase UbiE
MPSHHSAKSSHYNEQAEHYDAFNEKSSAAINCVVEGLLSKHKIKTVLDFTCGTGSQVFWLAKRGYEVVGCDINSRMLRIAKEKAAKGKFNVKLCKGDIRSTKVGQFDAVVAIFNAVGHLTKADFEKAMQNVAQNLHRGGLFVFDIFNLDYLLHANNITKLTIDWQTSTGKIKNREIQYSTIDSEGILASYTTCYGQSGTAKQTISKSAQTLQVYTTQQLREMLQRNGFEVVRQCGIDGTRLSKTKTERILTVARYMVA